MYVSDCIAGEWVKNMTREHVNNCIAGQRVKNTNTAS